MDYFSRETFSITRKRLLNKTILQYSEYTSVKNFAFIHLGNGSPAYRQLQNTSLRSHSSHSRDRTSSPTNLSDSNSSSNLPTNIDLPPTNSNNDGLITKYFRIIILSVISIVKLILEYLLLLYNQFKTYPIKTSLILCIFIIILIIHSFYLIKLAYRIENRLQSLHHKWPSSSMQNSLPPLKEL
jgi:hypothetical protein